ncbi:MAG TPA: hypothetical protein VHE14_03215 [Solirubrobacteraceae bacterium]|nr:hypothetical protein [Solirubrobacteraceae bacterium]
MNGRKLRLWSLIALMAIGSVAMWIVVPFGWVWVASQLTHSSQPTLGPYLLVIVAVPVSMVAIGKSLGVLNRVYSRVAGDEASERVQLPWLKSMRGERGSTRSRSVLDVVMVISVVVAGIAAGIWFFAFAGSSLPH